MNGSSRGPAIAAIVLGGLLLSSLSGLAYALLTNDAYEAGLERDRAREAAIAHDWCENVTPYVGRGHAVKSFGALADDASAGRLAVPEGMPGPRETADLDRWQAEHEVYVTSAYLTALEGFPADLSISGAAFKAAVEDAHEGKTSPISRSDLRMAAASIDRFIVETC